MFSAIRKIGWIAGLAALLQSPTGRKLIAQVKAKANDPATREKLTSLRTKYLGSARSN